MLFKRGVNQMPNKYLFLFLTPSLSFANISAEAEYGVSVLETQYSQAEAKVEVCKKSEESAQFTQAEKDALKTIPREHSVAIAYLSKQAWETCMQPELSEIASSLLTLQELNKQEQSQQLEIKINAIRNILFGGGRLAEEIEYNALPAETKQVLNNIDALQQPFNAMTLFEDVWGAPKY